MTKIPSLMLLMDVFFCFFNILVSGLISLLIPLLFLHNLLTIMSTSMKNEFLYSIAAVILQRSAPRSDFRCSRCDCYFGSGEFFSLHNCLNTDDHKVETDPH
jgi:hypothetical protein